MAEKALHRDLEEARDGVFRRAFRAERGAIDKEARTIELAFSSEEPYERWWGIEILDHSESSVRLGRLNDGAHPLLVNHDWDRQPGVIEKAWIGDDRRGRSTARFGRSAYAEEILQDVEDGIRSLVSVGYIVHKVIEQSTAKGAEPTERELTGDEFRALVQSEEFQRSLTDRHAAGDDPPVYRVVDWEPFENSIVAIPADATVGVGRSFTGAPAPLDKEKPTMGDDNKGQPAAAVPDVQAVTNEARQAELARIREISAMGAHYGMTEQAEKAVGEGATVDAFRKLVLEKLQKDAPNAATERNLGLSDKEVQRYSIARAILALASKDWTGAGFERECHLAAEKKNGDAKHQGILVPHDVLSRQMHAVQRGRGANEQISEAVLRTLIAQRDLTVASASGGGYLVGTTNLAGSFIELLRARARVVQLGAIVLPGLRESVTIPKQSAAGTFYWLSTEATAITESNQTFGQVALTPKNGGGYTEVSMQLLKQSSPAADMIVMNDLSRICSLGVDSAALQGSGASGQPTGVVNTSGIGSVTGTSLNWAGIVEFETDVAAANADVETMAYLTTPTVRGTLKSRDKTSTTVGNYVWGGTNLEKTLNGYRAEVTTQMPASSMLFGDWSQIVIGEWGTLEISMNPYANFPAGIVGIRGWVTVDVGVRQPSAFSYASSIT